jgi:restriction system protein
MKNSKKRKNKKIEEICSAGSSITMLAILYLSFKYREHWQVVTIGVAVFLICLLVLVFLITRIIRKKRIEKAMVTENYDSMSGEDFEEFCADILRGNGFSDVEVTKASGDHGVDVLAKKDGVKYAIQCKRYSKPVGNKTVQEVYSGKDIYKADVAVVMSNMDFTAQAIEDAKKLKVELWNRDKIYSLQKAGNKEIVPTPVKEETLVCPNCGGELVLRTAKKGSNAGNQFYGCSNYPNCKYTRSIY